MFFFVIAESGSAELVFVANIDGNWDMFTFSEDDKTLTRLTSTPHDEKDPSWSSDRKKIVYATSDGKLNIMDISTRNHEQLLVDGSSPAKFSPSFSPDDTKIAYIEFKKGVTDDTDLKVFNMKTRRSDILLDQYAGQFWPAWSPDGSNLVYANVHCLMDCGRIIQEIWMSDLRTGHARQLLMINSLSQQPDWSPDGKQIAFSTDISGNYDIWILSLEEQSLKQITTDKNLDVSPSWSPDGNKLAYISTSSGIMEIWVKDLVSGELKNLKPFGNKDIECKDVDW